MSRRFCEYIKDRTKRLEMLDKDVNDNKVSRDGIDLCLKEIISSDIFQVACQLDRIGDILEKRK